VSPARPLTVEVDGGIARMVLNRPQHLNALNTALLNAIVSTFAEPGRADDVRVVPVRRG
jgi:enoyl-CoA hydratase/carnithine racemase